MGAKASRKTIIVIFIFAIFIGYVNGNLLFREDGKDQQVSKQSIAEVLAKTIAEKGIKSAIEQYHRLKEEQFDRYDFAERQLNRLGIRLTLEEKITEAIEIFKLNVQAYPEAFNTYDSLGMAYMVKGDKKRAIKNYKKSIELNPGNEEGIRYAYVLENYTRKVAMIPMRDGVKLYTQIYDPIDKGEKYPIMIKRTPYNITSRWGGNAYIDVLGPSMLFTREGYIFVYQDVRGKYKSEGDFVVMKSHKTVKRGPQDTDESSDTYDTIQWLLKNIDNHNGRVGQWGISYPGWQTVMGMIDAHPALKASSPQASPADMWIGDDFHHNGAFRLMYTFNWLRHSAKIRTGLSGKREAPFQYGTPDGYKFFLELGPVANVNKKYFENTVPTWNEYMEHGDYDDYWQKQDVLQYLDNIKHPILNVAGWFDAEDFYGPMSIYYTIEKKNPHNKSTIIIGPWLHGGWASMAGDFLHPIQFKEKTGVYYREKVELPFFNFYLKDKGQLDLPEALVFETGSNQWKSYKKWPPAAAVEKNLYLNNDGQLSFIPPGEESDEANDAYISDPHKPVPFSPRTLNRQAHLWMVEDQRFAARRPDVLVYQSDVLTEDVTISGPIIASIYVSTSGTDADWVVKLIDVYPGEAQDIEPNPRLVRMGDYQMLLAGEVIRGKYRNSFQKPEPFVPGQVTKIEFSLRDKCHCFLKGHRIMVQIQSTWFPVIDRNPQKFLDIYHAKAEDFQKAEMKVYRSKKYPSHLKIKVMRNP